MVMMRIRLNFISLLKVIFVLFVAKIWITPCAAVMDQMLDAGFWILDI
jgi:hypothetical protein